MVNIHSELYTLYDLAPQHIIMFLQWLIASYGNSKPKHILDVGCGPGRLLQPLTEISKQVTGIDPDPNYAAYAKQLTQKHKHIFVKQGGFADIDAANQYDLIAAVNAPFAYLLDDVARLDALNRMYRALSVGGVLLLEVPNFLYMLKGYRPAKDSIIHNENGREIRRVIRHDVSFHDAIWTHIDQFYVDGLLQSTQTHTMSVVTVPHLIGLIAQNGFQEIRTYNSYANRSSQPIKGEKILISAQKSQADLYL